MRWWFGRILTFEVLGDDDAPSVASILHDASGGAVVSAASATVHGYAAYGANRRSAIAPLVDHFAASLFDDGFQLRSPVSELGEVKEFELGCSADGGFAPKLERAQMPATVLPSSLSLSYYDPSRDFQTGQMRASAAARSGVDAVEELPAAMSADKAKALVERHIAEKWARRDKLVLRLPPDRIAIEPGALLTIDDGTVWRIEEATVEEMVVRIELSPVSEGIASAPADPGSHLPAPDLVASPTALTLIELPDFGVGRHDVPILHVAACQPSAPWRPVGIELSAAGEVRTIASAVKEAVVGTARTILGPGQSAIFDLVNSVEVELADQDHWLESRNDGALANGANLAMLGEELIQFGDAMPLGGRRFRLSRLLRGRRGTEWALHSHAGQEAFALVDTTSLQAVELPMSAVGTMVSVKAQGLADDDAQPLERIVRGEALRPPSPVHVRAVRSASGVLHISWVRRSRSGWDWVDGVDAPLGESSERYRVRLAMADEEMLVETGKPLATFTADDLVGFGTGGLTISIVQVGDYAESRPATLILQETEWKRPD